MTTSFYVTLPSNVTGQVLFERNTISNYVTRLATNLSLDGFEVGLSEISYTKSWFNLVEDQSICVLDADGMMHTNGYEIKAGRYDDQQELVDYINRGLSTYKSDVIQQPPRFELNKHSRKITNLAGRDRCDASCDALLPLEIRNMLGFGDSFFAQRLGYSSIPTLHDTQIEIVQKSIKGDYDAFHSYDMNAGVHSLYVYCDIIEPSIVGDTYSQLLRVVEIPGSVPFGDQCIIRYEKPYYFSLNTRSFQTIEIDIKDDSGERINFNFGRTRVV